MELTFEIFAQVQKVEEVDITAEGNEYIDITLLSLLLPKASNRCCAISSGWPKTSGDHHCQKIIPAFIAAGINVIQCLS